MLLMLLCVGPMKAKATVYDFMGTATGRDRLALDSRGMTDGSPVSGFMDLENVETSPDDPTIVRFEIFAGTLHGYNLEDPIDYAKDHLRGDNVILGEWVEEGGQRTGSPDVAHEFMFLPSFNMRTLHGGGGLYSLYDQPLDGIPEFTIDTHLTLRQDNQRFAENAADAPVPEPPTMGLTAIGLIALLKKIT